MRIVIHDDASIDNSASIIRKWCIEFPDKIVAILQNENVFSSKVNIVQEISKVFKSKFIARLDADDFWNSTNKIQAQYEVLEQNPLVTLVCHPCYFLNELDGTYKLVQLRKTGIIKSRNLALVNFIQSPTVMFRAIAIFDLPKKFTDFYIQDWPMWAVVGSRGKIQYLPQIYSTYRIHSANGFAGKRNSEFAETRLGITRMVRDYLQQPLRKYWSLMTSLRVFFGFLDKNVSGYSITILNSLCNKAVGIKVKTKEPID